MPASCFPSRSRTDSSADGGSPGASRRPEHLALGSGASGIAVEVSVVEPTGSETLVVGRTGGEEIHVVFHERHSFAPGERIRVVPDLDRIHLFAPEDGVRL